MKYWEEMTPEEQEIEELEYKFQAISATEFGKMLDGMFDPATGSFSKDEGTQ